MHTNDEQDRTYSLQGVEITDRTAVIRTTDRMTFRSCRRKWNWTSALKENLVGEVYPVYFWLGTGIHFALEDYHGYNKFGHPVNAFYAYANATQKAGMLKGFLPGEFDEQAELCEDMLHYYVDHWLKSRNPLKTLWIDGVPQVEINLLHPLDVDLKKIKANKHWDNVIYSATIDRVAEDEYGRLWAIDYKTCNQFRHPNPNDAQASMYTWMAHEHFGRPIEGLIYWQFLKTSPCLTILKKGLPSLAKTKKCSASMLRTWFKEEGYESNDIPIDYRDRIVELMKQETPDSDDYIQREYIRRTREQHESEGRKLLMELEDMLNPDLPLYPNPSYFNCTSCQFLEPCMSLDDGTEDYTDQLKTFVSNREENWREHIEWPQ